MAEEPVDKDLEAWHRRFAVDANNRAWLLANKEQPTDDERTEMLQAAHAAGYHCAQVGQQEQIAQSDMLQGRVHSILGHGGLAIEFARRAFDYISAQKSEPLTVALAHAVMSHAAATSRDIQRHFEHYTKAKELGNALEGSQDKETFFTVFRSIPEPPGAKPSRTSVWVAAARALGARDPDEKVRNPDWLAGQLIGPDELALLGDSAIAAVWGQPYEAASQNAEAMSTARTMIPRTRFIDERLESAVKEGAAQVVLLGAGFDTRAYRLTDLLSKTNVFEVDQPFSQAMKMKRVRDVIGAPPANLRYVPVDFRTNNLGEELAKAGYRADQKTFFNWEGVTMYLPGEAVQETLRWVAANSAPGSTIVFDYSYDATVRFLANINPEQLPSPQKEAMLRFRRLTAGEPWVFGLPAGKEAEFMQGLGFELKKVLGLNSEEAVSQYLTRADGSIFGTLPASPQQFYLILEATVR